MRKMIFAALTIALFLAVNACKKSSSSSTNSSARTVQNFSGSYSLTALTAGFSGLTINLYDSLKPCEKDNIIILNSNLTAQFQDAGIVCVPPEDSTGIWSLSQNTDSIYVGGTANFIKSWDGRNLIITTDQQVNGFPVTATSTLVKK